jgi:mannose-1-phosphate guanylyltransferase
VPGEITLLGPCVVVAADTPLAELAARYLAQVGGAILAAHDDADIGDVLVEARARGAAPMLRIDAREVVQLGTDPAVLVVASDDAAEQLGIPRL